MAYGGGSGGWRPSTSDDPSSVVDPLTLEAIGRRMRWAGVVAPDASEDPGSVQGITALAQSAKSDGEFQSQINSMYGFNESGKMAAELLASPPDIAQIHYAQLPKAMQAAVRRQGFVPKEYGDAAKGGDGTSSGIFGSIPGVGGIAQAVSGAFGEHVIAPLAEGMNKLGRGSTQTYRAAVDLNQDHPGMGGLESILDPHAWAKSWSDVGNGATYMLDDDRKTVKDQYDLTDDELDTYLHMAEGKLPGEIAEDEGLVQGTQEHSARVQYLYDLANTPTGKELVGDPSNPLNGGDGMLNNYRVSFGRIWTRRAGVQPKNLDNGMGKLISGAGDMAWALSADPTLIGGKIFKGVKGAQLGIEAFEDVGKLVNGARAARAIAHEGYTVGQHLGVPGLRNVMIRDAKGIEQGTLSLSRLRKGERTLAGAELWSAALNPAKSDAVSAARTKLFRTLPGAYDSFDTVFQHSLELAAKKGDDGLHNVDNFLDFLDSQAGYIELTGSKLGGRNTAEFLRLPEVGKATEAKLLAKQTLATAQDWATRSDRALYDAIGDAPGRFSQVINNVTPIRINKITALDEEGKVIREGQKLGLSLNPVRTAARAAISPLRFSKIFTTHVPRGGWIGLWAEDGLAEFQRFLDMGETLGMDSKQLATYRDDFIGWGTRNADDEVRGIAGKSAAQRSMAIRTFTTDLLSHFDIAEDGKLMGKFVDRMDEIYALDVNSVAKKSMAMALSQTAEAAAIPSFRDLMLATNRYSTMRAIFGRGGALNPQLLDAGLTKVWKPAVLMRAGFIGRAAGEELLGYLARYGTANYIGQTLAQDVVKKKLYREVMANVDSGNPTKELIRQLREYKPDQWDDMVSWAEKQGGKSLRPGDIPDPREILSWGQSQALAPFTGVVHSMDSFMQKVILSPWQHDLTGAPKWRVAAANRMRQADNAALHMSIRTARRNERIGEVINTGIQHIPGLHATGQALDAALGGIMQRYLIHYPTFTEISHQVGLPSKEQAARLLLHADDQDFAALEEMLTDPVIRRAQLEHITGGNTINLRMEPGTEGAEDLAQSFTQVNKRTGASQEVSMLPESGKMHKVGRSEGVRNGQDSLNFLMAYQERVRHIMDPKTQMGRVAVRRLSHHFPEGSLREIGSTVRGLGMAEGTDMEVTQKLLHQVQGLPLEDQRALQEAVEGRGVKTLAQEMANKVTGTTVEENLHRQTLQALATLDDAMHAKVLNPHIKPDEISSSFEDIREQLRLDLRREAGKPGNQRLYRGWEGYADNLKVPPREGFMPAYTVGAKHGTATWAAQNLVTTEGDTAMRDAFAADLALRLKTKRLPDLSETIADQIFNPQYPASTILGDMRTAKMTTSMPISMVASSNPDLMDEVANALATVTKRPDYHLQRLDIPDVRFNSREKIPGLDILDKQRDWERSELWNVQPEDFSDMTPLPQGARGYLVQSADPEMASYGERAFGPVSPLRDADVRPVTTRWEPTMDEHGVRIDDIMDALPDPEEGKVRVWGVQNADEPPRYFVAHDVNQAMAQAPGEGDVKWFFSDVPEGTVLDEAGQLPEGFTGQHFASETHHPDAILHDNGVTEPGFHATPHPFEYQNLPEAGWGPGFSPTHYVAENENDLRRLANIVSHRIHPDEITPEMRGVITRLGGNAEDLTGEGTLANLSRLDLSHRAEAMLVEGRKGGLLSGQRWWDEDDLKRIADGMGGEWTGDDVDALINHVEEYRNQALTDSLEPDPSKIGNGRERFLQDTGVDVDTAGRLMEMARGLGQRTDPEAVAARNNLVDILDHAAPGWRGSEGWNRVGTKDMFGIENSVEPSAIRGAGRKQISVGVSPAEKSNDLTDTQLDNIIRHFTNLYSGGTDEVRGLDNILFPLSMNPSPQTVDLGLVQREDIRNLPQETFGRKYITQKDYAWDRLTNWFFDDAASKGISSIVRNQLFGTNYMKAARLTRGLADNMIDAKLVEEVRPILDKLNHSTPEALDELTRQQRHSMVELPFHTIDPWDEPGAFDELGNKLPTLETLGPQVHRQEMQRDAIMGVQNSPLKVPLPEVPIPQANDQLRHLMGGLEDTPLQQAIREAIAPIKADIGAERRLVGNKAMVGGQAHAKRAVAEWDEANAAVHERRLQTAADNAAADVSAARAKGQQLQTDPNDLTKSIGINQEETYTKNYKDYVNDLSGPELTTLRHYMNQRINALDTVRDATMHRAMEATIPFIDDHRVRSQFQEYVGNLVPFWFAEEQFLKRWARIFKESPDAFRKGQLAMHGLRTIGAVQKDMTGREYYVYPGSAAATSMFTGTVGKLLFGSNASLPTGLSMTGDVKATLPGFGSQMGVPMPGPFVGMGLEMLASHSPEYAKAQTAIMGEQGSNRQLISYLVPTSVSRVWSAFTSNTDEAGLASAMIETAQMMEASGNGLKEDATPGERQEYLDKIQANARSVQGLRALMGFVTPASPGIDASRDLPLSDEFQTLIQSGLPYPEALMKFMEHHHGDVSPYVVYRSETPTGAPLAATQDALEKMDGYAKQIKEFPNAAPWMLLPFRTADDEFTNRAYRQQLRMGLRKYRKIDEYVDALSWADASPEYFDTMEEYDTQIEAARQVEDQDQVNIVSDQKAAFASAYKNTHPMFAHKLMSSEGRAERQQILTESYQLADRPDVQGHPGMAAMSEMLQRYQTYKDALVGLNQSRAKAVVEYKDQMTAEFQGWLGIHIIEHPELRYFYDRVLRPELQWNSTAVDENLET